MKTLFASLGLILACVSVADEAHFSTETKVLSVPALVIDGVAYYENVFLELDIDSGKFTVLSSQEVEFPTGPQLLEIEFGQTKVLREAATIRFVAVQSDSRCPLLVQCITAGFVEIAFELHDDRVDRNFEFKLRLDGEVDKGDPGAEANGLYFRINGVNPYPSDTNGIIDEDYKAVLEYSSEPF